MINYQKLANSAAKELMEISKDRTSWVFLKSKVSFYDLFCQLILIIFTFIINNFNKYILS